MKILNVGKFNHNNSGISLVRPCNLPKSDEKLKENIKKTVQKNHQHFVLNYQPSLKIQVEYFLVFLSLQYQ